MKKILALALTLALIATLSVVSFAVNYPDASANPADQNVTDTQLKVNYTGKDPAADSFSLDVEWEDTTFTYNAGNAGVWNPEEHDYDAVEDPRWTDSTAAVIITNHSNVEVTATITVTNSTGFNVTSDANTLNFPSAVGKAVDAAELTKTFTLTVNSGVPTANEQVVATATVSFAKTVTQG